MRATHCAHGCPWSRADCNDCATATREGQFCQPFHNTGPGDYLHCICIASRPALRATSKIEPLRLPTLLIDTKSRAHAGHAFKGRAATVMWNAMQVRNQGCVDDTTTYAKVLCEAGGVRLRGRCGVNGDAADELQWSRSCIVRLRVLSTLEIDTSRSVDTMLLLARQ